MSYANSEYGSQIVKEANERARLIVERVKETGSMTDIANEMGLSRERIRQICLKQGYSTKGFFSCQVCGRIKYGFARDKKCNQCSVFFYNHQIERTPENIQLLKEQRLARSRKPFCPRGHAMEGDNIGLSGPKKTKRYCKTCHKEDMSNRYKRLMADPKLKQELRLKGRDYQKKWTIRNREEIRRKSRDRYANDPVYRQYVLGQAAAYQQRLRLKKKLSQLG